MAITATVFEEKELEIDFQALEIEDLDWFLTKFLVHFVMMIIYSKRTHTWHIDNLWIDS